MSLPSLRHANAHFVTPQLLIGGDLSFDQSTAAGQLEELVDAGVTHIVDVRVEANDAPLVAELAPEVDYLHHGIDDAGQRVAARLLRHHRRLRREAIDAGGVVLTHCHMGINRGPSLGFAILLHQGWDPVDALTAIRAARRSPTSTTPATRSCGTTSGSATAARRSGTTSSGSASGAKPATSTSSR